MKYLPSRGTFLHDFAASEISQRPTRHQTLDNHILPFFKILESSLHRVPLELFVAGLPEKANNNLGDLTFYPISFIKKTGF